MSWTFLYFYQKPLKSQSFVRHISKHSLIQSSLFGSSSNFCTCEYSCTPGYPRFPWLIIPLRQACTRSISCSGSQLNHPFTSCSSTQLQELFQIPWGTCVKSCDISETENTTTCKIFFFFFFSVSRLCKPHFPGFYQAAGRTNSRASLWDGWHTEWEDVASPMDKANGVDSLWIVFKGGTAGCLPSPKTMMTSSYESPKQERPHR